MLRNKGKLVTNYVASIPFDQRLHRQDIEGSIAHTKMLAKQGIILESDAEAKKQKLHFWKDKIGN